MDKQMIAALFKKDMGGIRQLLGTMEDDWDVVDELVSDVFVRVLEDADNFDPDRSAPTTWIFNIAKQVAVDHVRKMQADKRRNEVLASSMATDVDEYGCPIEYYERTDLSMDAKDASDNLNPAGVVEAEDAYDDAVRRMPALMQTVLAGRRLGYTNPQIAAHSGCSEKTVRNLISEAHKYFRDNPVFNTDNIVYERESEHKFSWLDWANEVTRLPTRASMEDVREQQLKRFHLADTAMKLNKERRT